MVQLATKLKKTTSATACLASGAAMRKKVDTSERQGSPICSVLSTLITITRGW